MTLYPVYKNGKGIATVAKRTDMHAHCKGRVNVGYINKSIDRAHYIVGAVNEKNATLTGFACIQVRARSLYVSTLCSHGKQGGALMKKVFLLGKLLGKKQVLLDSIASAVAFYKHIGFQHNRGKHSNGVFRMHRDMSTEKQM